MMKSIYLAGPNKFEARDIPRPVPAAGEVLIAVRAAGICGSDRHYLSPGYEHDFAASPLIIGHEGAGEIVELGPGVSRLKVGDRVAIESARPCRHCEFCRTGFANRCPDVAFLGYPPYDGLMREFIAYPAEDVEADGSAALSFDDLMMLEPFAIAINTLDVVGFRAGWTAGVVGCGAIGLSVIAALKAAGAAQVFATDIRDYKRDWAMRYGADVFINPAREDAPAAVEQATRGRGVDAAFECAGAQSAQDQAMFMVRPAGVLGLLGINPEGRLELDADRLRRRGIAIYCIRRANETLHRAMSLAVKRDLRLGEIVTHSYPLAQLPVAMSNFMDYAGGVVKACVHL